jgi:outer membrane protein TolC
MKMTLLNRLLVIVAGFLILQQVEAQEVLTLSMALEKALENNYGLIISKADHEIAAINNNPGNAGRYPTIGFDASASNNFNLKSDSYTGRFLAGIGLNWVIFDGFRVNLTKAKLDNLESLSEGRLGVVIESTIEEVIMGYYLVLLQQEQLKVLQTVMNLSDDRYQYEMDRKSLGGSVTYNVLQAQNVYLTDKANFMNQEVVVRNSVRNLNFLLGESPTTTWMFSELFEADTTQYRLADLLDKMKASNQTLQNQYTNLLLTENETSLKRASYSPTLSLASGIEYNDLLTAAAGQPATSSGALSPYGTLRLSYDIYSAGVRRRSVEVARINEEIAQVEISEMEHALTNELFNLADYYGVRLELLNVANENMAAAELNLSISEDKYRSGVINSFNYRDVQLIYLNAALRRLQSIYNLIDSKTQLTRMTGGFLGTAQQ